MSKTINFAVKFEEEIVRQLETLKQTDSEEITSILDAVIKAEEKIIKVLKDAQKLDISLDTYKQIGIDKILDKDNAFVDFMKNKDADFLKIFCELTAISALIDRSAQFYSQSAANNSNPTLKLFLSSLAQVKNVLRGRLKGCIRSVSNDIWQEVGFAPFALGKD